MKMKRFISIHLFDKMKLTLKNFRCYTEKTFDLGEKGITLLSGGSGEGKSSIVIAINFVLFGTGTKLIHYGKTSCKVELEFQGMKIVRTKRPNRLVVNEVYEDDAGQDIINKTFGKTFGVTGYIAQNALNSFILMSPLEKLAFLEKFAFKNVDLLSIKKRCKDVLKERHETLLKSSAQLELASETLKELEKPEEVEFPLQYKGKNKEKAMKNERIRLKNSSILLKRSHKSLGNYQQELTDTKVMNAKKTSKRDNIKRIQEDLDEIAIELDGIEYKGEKVLAKKRSLLEDIVSLRETENLEKRLKDDTNRLNDMKTLEKEAMKEQMVKISSTLWKEYSVTEVRDTIKEYKSILKDLDKLHNVVRQIKSYNVDEKRIMKDEQRLEKEKEELSRVEKCYRQLVLQQNVYECPECDTKLQMKDDALVKIEEVDETIEDKDIEEVEDDIRIMKDSIQALEQKIFTSKSQLEKLKELEEERRCIEDMYEDAPPSKDSVQEDLQYIQDYRHTQLELERKKIRLEKDIENDVYSSSLEQFQSGISSMEKRLADLRKKTKGIENVDEEELRSFVQDQTVAASKIKELEERQTKLEKERKRENHTLEDLDKTHLKKYKEVREEEKLEELITTRKTQITELENKRGEHSRNVAGIEAYKRYSEELDKFSTWENREKSLTKEEEKNRDKYAAVSLLKEKIGEAESLAVSNIVESINTHAQIYLDSFFPEDPISVVLKTFKETKKNRKAQINLQIDYKGMEADLNMLSGGELSRVILAFTLALGEMFNTPLIMLDECTSSLDQELTTTVFDALRLGFKDKLVLCICHQVVVGNAFDRVIQVRND